MTYSVAIPAYNAAKTIGQTLAAVLNQTVPPRDVVVIDDGSTDETATIASAFSDTVRVLRQDNMGCGAAFTRAVRQTMMPVIAAVDADDVWLPHKMERQLSVLAETGPNTLIFARHRLFRHGSGDHTSGPTRPGLTRSDMVMTRDVFENVGDVIDPPGGRGEMIDWFARARELGFVFRNVDEVLVLRRIIPGSLSYGRDATKDRGYLAVAHRALQRRKGTQTDQDQ